MTAKMKKVKYKVGRNGCVSEFTSDHGHRTDEPLHTISAGGTHLGEVRAFLMSCYGTSVGSDLREPMRTVTTTVISLRKRTRLPSAAIPCVRRLQKRW